MATLAFELVDAGVVVAREDVLIEVSPGVALLDPAGLLMGREAAAQARLKPVYAYDRFWSDLTADPLPRPVPEARTRADLGFRHLSRLWAGAAQPGDEGLLAVPGTMRPAELGLLGGIAAAVSIPVIGYVDLAVAACAPIDACETVLHLDLQLYQAVLTELRGSDTLARHRVEVAPRVGLRAVQAAWAQLVSEAMVRRTRLDPLHLAATEQQLHDRLPGWVQQLAGSDAVDAEIDASAGRFGVSLRREQFVFAAEAYYSQLSDLIHSARRAGEPVTIALSARSASLPQLAERCASLSDADVVVLGEGAAALGALACVDAFDAAAPVALVTALKRTNASRRLAPARPVRGTPPTHVVFGGRAYAIGREPLVLGLAPQAARPLMLTGPAAGVSRTHCTLVAEDGAVLVRDHSRYGTYVNGERITGRAGLCAGDRLRLGTPGIVLELVAAG